MLARRLTSGEWWRSWGSWIALVALLSAALVVLFAEEHPGLAQQLPAGMSGEALAALAAAAGTSAGAAIPGAALTSRVVSTKIPLDTSYLQFEEDGTPRPFEVSLANCVYLALKNNLDIAIRRLDPEIKGAQVLAEKGDFDTTLFTDYSYRKSVKDPNVQEIAGEGDAFTRTSTVTLDTGFRGNLVSGGDYELNYSQTRTGGDQNRRSGIGNQYDSQVGFSLTQPLLKNFGVDVATKDIQIASNDRTASVYQFKGQVIDTITEVQNAYWELVRAIENVAVAEESLTLAENLLEQNKIRAEVGVIAPLEVLQAEAGVASREETVIVARSEIERAQDRLFVFIDPGRKPKAFNVKIVPRDKPSLVVHRFDIDESIQTALQNRPDLADMKKKIENQQINLSFARNQLLPSVDLEAAYNYSGVSEHIDETLDGPFSFDFPTWTWGLNLSVPIGNRLARGGYTVAALELEKMKRTIENLELSVIVEVRDAVRNIETNLKRIEVTRTSTNLAEEALEAERKKYDVGISTSHDVLEFQEDLTKERSDEVAAIIDYNKSLIQLERAMGTSLERYKIGVAGFPKS